MKRHLVIAAEPISEQALQTERSLGDQTGAVVSFLGIVRGTETDRPIVGIEYEAFVPMAEHQFGLIFDELERRWPVQSVRLVHRVGFVAVGEPSLWVEVTAAHRSEAFAACEHLINEMKRVVPIWKRAVMEPPAQEATGS
jgi:molybdopterin synthase catalytic subunit